MEVVAELTSGYVNEIMMSITLKTTVLIGL